MRSVFFSCRVPVVGFVLPVNHKLCLGGRVLLLPHLLSRAVEVCPMNSSSPRLPRASQPPAAGSLHVTLAPSDTCDGLHKGHLKGLHGVQWPFCWGTLGASAQPFSCFSCQCVPRRRMCIANSTQTSRQPPNHLLLHSGGAPAPPPGG